MSTENSTKAPGQNKEYTITVNAREKVVQDHKLDYNDIVKLSGLTGTDITSYVITFERGVGNATGNVSDGESIVLKDGMVFNVTNCNRS